MGNYVVVTTTESDDAGPTKPGAINGGFYGRMPDYPMQYPSVVIAVEDAERSVEKVIAAGRPGAGRADGHSGRGTVRLLPGLRGQPGESAAAVAAQVAGAVRPTSP